MKVDLPDDLNFDTPEDTATGTLEKVGRGGAIIVTLAMTRLQEARTALEEGRFVDALRHTQEAEAKMGPLATAESSLASFADRTRIVRAEEVEVGTSIMGWGRVQKIERREVNHAAGQHGEHIIFDCGESDGPNEVHPERELFVLMEGLDVSDDH